MRVSAEVLGPLRGPGRDSGPSPLPVVAGVFPDRPRQTTHGDFAGLAKGRQPHSSTMLMSKGTPKAPRPASVSPTARVPICPGVALGLCSKRRDPFRVWAASSAAARVSTRVTPARASPPRLHGRPPRFRAVPTWQQESFRRLVSRARWLFTFSDDTRN